MHPEFSLSKPESDQEADPYHQFLDPENNVSDIMDQFLGSETDILGEGIIMFKEVLNVFQGRLRCVPRDP